MLSKQVTKIVQNLEKKKFREKYNLFKIEGEKLVGELLHSPLKIHSLIAFPSWLEQNKKALSNVNIIEADEREMHGISNFQSLPEVIALAEIPVHIYRKEEVLDSLSLVLNGIQAVSYTHLDVYKRQQHPFTIKSQSSAFPAGPGNQGRISLILPMKAEQGRYIDI